MVGHREEGLESTGPRSERWRVIMARNDARALRGFQHLSFSLPSGSGVRGRLALDAALAERNSTLTGPDSGGRFQVSIAQVPQMLVARVRSTPVQLKWARDGLATDHVVMTVAPAGASKVTTDGEIWHADPGVVLVPHGQADVCFDLVERVDEAFLISASPAVLRDVDLPEPPAHGPLRVDEAAMRPQLAFLRALTEVVLPAEGNPRVYRSAVQVVRSLAGLLRDAAGSDLDLYSRGIEMIERSHAHPRLRVSDIADTLGVAERTLGAAFAERGTTVLRELRAVRAAVAIDARRGRSRMSRAAIARIAGFGSVSAMVRGIADYERDEGGDRD